MKLSIVQKLELRRFAREARNCSTNGLVSSISNKDFYSFIESYTPVVSREGTTVTDVTVDKYYGSPVQSIIYCKSSDELQLHDNIYLMVRVPLNSYYDNSKVYSEHIEYNVTYMKHYYAVKKEVVDYIMQYINK